MVGLRWVVCNNDCCPSLIIGGLINLEVLDINENLSHWLVYKNLATINRDKVQFYSRYLFKTYNLKKV